MSRSNRTAHGLITRVELDYSEYSQIGRARLSRGILAHYRELMRERHRDVFLQVYDETIGAPFAWPALRFNRPENLN